MILSSEAHVLGACPTLTGLLRRTIRNHLRRSRPEKILNVFVFQRIHFRFFQACGLASGRTSFASSQPAISDRLLTQYNQMGLFSKGWRVRHALPEDGTYEFLGFLQPSVDSAAVSLPVQKSKKHSSSSCPADGR